MEFDLNALLEQIKDPRQGLPILAVLIILNTLLGAITASKKDDFDRYYLLNFLRSRVVYQAIPVAVTGFGAIYLNMPLLSWFYVTTAVIMAGDLVVDLKVKIGELFTRKA